MRTITAERTDALSNSSTEGPILNELFNDAPALCDLLDEQLAVGGWLDAFLFTAGLSQLLEDHAPHPLEIARRAASYLGGLEGAARLAGNVLARVDATVARSPLSGHRIDPRVGAARAFLVSLATRVLDLPQTVSDRALATEGQRFLAGLRSDLPLLGEDVVRMPSCFRSFDQHPEDFACLAGRFALARPDQARPVMVVGLRTSGSYLAPIVTASLSSLNYTSVRYCTARPGWPTAKSDLANLRAAGRHGSVVIVDDPPMSGRSITQLVEELVACGVARGSMLALLAVFEELPSSGLGDVEMVTLPFSEWAIHRRINEQAVGTAFGRLVVGQGELRATRRLPDRPVDHMRGHARAAFEVAFRTPNGEEHEERIVAEGVGLGYLGRHALAVVNAAPDLVPEVHGIVDGVLFREYLPDEDRLEYASLDADFVGLQVAEHIVRRKAALQVPHDRAGLLSGRQPAWEVSARLVARSFGRHAMLARPVLVDPLLRSIFCDVAEPSITDGFPARRLWFAGNQVARKLDFAEGPFGHLDLASYDALSDLAGAAVAFESRAVTVALREHFVRRTGAPIDPAKWMLYQLVYLWDARRRGERSAEAFRRGAARLMQEFYAACFLADLPPVRGPLVVFDIDGCLETSPLGYPATTRAGALALRALHAHGYSVLLASGRSAGEIAERCEYYGALGGVAEYGAYVVLPDGRTLPTFDDEATTALGQLNAELETEAFEIDHDFSGVVRAYRRIGSRRHSMSHDQAELVLRRSGTSSRLRTVHGEEQTDFVPRTINKGRGLDALKVFIAPEVAADSTQWLHAAIGDSESDIPMLERSARPFAPRNATPQLSRPGVTRVHGRYQVGCFDAVAALVGHAPGCCHCCAPPVMPSKTTALIDLLAIQQGGVQGAPRALLSLVTALAGMRRA